MSTTSSKSELDFHRDQTHSSRMFFGPIYRLALILFLLLALPVMGLRAAEKQASGAEPPKIDEISLCYQLAFGGLPFGTLSFSHASGGIAEPGYRADLLAENFAMFDKFARFRYVATSGGKLGSPTDPTPDNFVALDGIWPRRRRIEMHFDTISGAVSTRITPPQKRAKAVAPDKRIGSVDPLTAIIRARTQIWRQFKNGTKDIESTIRLPVYDGRYRYDIEFRIKGKDKRYQGGWDRPVIHTQAWLLPIAGFNERQLKELPPSPFDIYLSADEEFVPIYAEAGWTSMSLVKTTNGGRRCDG